MNIVSFHDPASARSVNLSNIEIVVFLKKLRCHIGGEIEQENLVSDELIRSPNTNVRRL